MNTHARISLISLGFAIMALGLMTPATLASAFGDVKCDGVGNPRTFPANPIPQNTPYSFDSQDDAVANAAADCENCIGKPEECPMSGSGSQAFGSGSITYDELPSGQRSYKLYFPDGGEVVVTCTPC